MNNYKKTNLIALAMLFFMTGIVGTRPLIPLLSDKLGASTFEIGIIIAFFSLLPLFLAVKLGYWVDKFGPLPFLTLSSIIGGTSLILPLMFNDLTGVYLSQIAGGMAQTSFLLAAQSFVNFNSTQTTREKNISVLSIGIAGGGFIGPLIGGWFSDLFGYIETIALLGGGLYLAFLIIIYIYILDLTGENSDSEKRIPSVISEDKESVVKLLKNKNLRKVMLIGMLVLLTKDLYLYFFPLLARDFGYSTTLIGLIIGFHNGAGIIIRWFLTSIIKKWGKSEVIVASIIFSGLLFGLLPFTNVLLLSMIISMLLGALLGIGQPLSITSAINFSPDNRTGEILGLRLAFNRFIQITSPIIFGGVASLFNLSIVFWIVAITLVIGSTKSFIEEESKLRKK